MFEAIYYVVTRVDGDFVYLKSDGEDSEKCVARAFMPCEVNEGTRLKYEFLEYSLAEDER